MRLLIKILLSSTIFLPSCVNAPLKPMPTTHAFFAEIVPGQTSVCMPELDFQNITEHILRCEAFEVPLK